MAKILMITPAFYPSRGGVETHVRRVSEELAKRGWQVRVLTKLIGNAVEQEKIGKLAVFRFKFPLVKLLGLLVIWWKLIVQYWQLVRWADVVHAHDVFLWYLPLRLIFWRKKVVTTFHGWEGKYPIPWKNIFFKKLAARLSDKTVAIGKYVEKYYDIKTDLVIYGGVDVPSKLPKKQNLLLYVGRLSEDTGLPLLLDTLKNNAWQGKVVFCGDGELRGRAEKFGEVVGFADPKSYLRKARVVFAGGYLSALEALAHQCSVAVAADNELKKDYWRLSAFSNQLNFLEENEIGGKGKELSKKFIEGFSWSSVAKKYEKLYPLP